MSVNIFFNGWFGGFFDKTNPGLHVDFFLELYEKVYNQKCKVGTLDNSDVLCEFDMLIQTQSLVSRKKWRHTYLFSGESSLKCKPEDYTCVLWGERNNNNVVNIPLFIAYIYTNKFINLLTSLEPRKIRFPNLDVLVIISNPNGIVRNKFLNQLEQHFHVTYAGRFKNNIGTSIPFDYNTQEFADYVSKFKFIISMENSQYDTYITEKIIHGFVSKTIPVYYGSSRIYDYFNPKRFLCLEDESDRSIQLLIQRMKDVGNNEDKWFKMIQEPTFIDNKLPLSLDSICSHIQCVINSCEWSTLSRVYCVVNQLFELHHYERLNKMFTEQDIPHWMISYISPTYKHTITEEIYNSNISEQLVLSLRTLKMKNSELSLFLNYKAIMEHIVKTYSDGMFLILESDVYPGKQIEQFGDFLVSIKDREWDIIHVGMYDNRMWGTPNFTSNTGYTKRIMHNNHQPIEDITTEGDKYRLSRKFYTRCTDSFIWRYSAIKKYLEYQQNNPNFGVPMDYYMCNFFEKNINIKHYWSNDEFFIQGSNIHLCSSSIQTDKD